MSRGGYGKEGGRPKSSVRRILDVNTRERRIKNSIAALDNDNFHDDPHGDLVANKSAPKFHDKLGRASRRGRKSKGSEYYKFKYRKTLSQMLEYEMQCHPDEKTFMDVAAPPSKLPKRHFCAVCGFPAPYNCITCGMRFCTIPCQKTHVETRCLKWTV